MSGLGHGTNSLARERAAREADGWARYRDHSRRGPRDGADLGQEELAYAPLGVSLLSLGIVTMIDRARPFGCAPWLRELCSARTSFVRSVTRARIMMGTASPRGLRRLVGACYRAADLDRGACQWYSASERDRN